MCGRGKRHAEVQTDLASQLRRHLEQGVRGQLETDSDGIALDRAFGAVLRDTDVLPDLDGEVVRVCREGHWGRARETPVACELVAGAPHSAFDLHAGQAQTHSVQPSAVRDYLD